MLERVIENWLVNATERQYQIPFCQLLSAEGETVIYVSTHGPLELGIDVLTLDTNGFPKAYQLKMGNVALGEWRQYLGEVVQLVESHPSTPALPKNSPQHQPFLVTNGVFRDTVLNAIRQQNESWVNRSYKPLIPVSKDELLARFRVAHAQYFPNEVDDLNTFFQLYASRGEDTIHKPVLCRFVENILPFKNETLSDMDMQRACASLVLVITYLVQKKLDRQNHWACFEAWTIAGASILALAARTSIDKKFWEYSFSLCDQQALQSLQNLAEECQNNNTGLTQGSPFSDGAVYAPRIAILNGLMSVLKLRQILRRDVPDRFSRYADEFVDKHWNKGKIWGESGAPMVVFTALSLEASGKQSLAEAIVINLMDSICLVNRKGAGGLPNVYWSAQAALRLSLGLDQQPMEDFEQSSYILESLVHFLARRWRRVALRARWEALTHLHYVTPLIAAGHEWLLWNAPSSTLDTRSPSQPQSWAALIEHSEGLQENSFPPLLKSRPEFLLFFLTVYPHRFQPISMKIMDIALRA